MTALLLLASLVSMLAIWVLLHVLIPLKDSRGDVILATRWDYWCGHFPGYKRI